MTTQPRFAAVSRLLHWLMAPMIIAMLFIGVDMAASVSRRYDLFVSIHRPLGIAILVLCIARIVNRFINPPPDLPDTVPPLQRFAAKASHIALYALMLMMPLVGWGMLSAARYPIVLYGPVQLPPILPHDLTLYAWLRELHTVLAYLLFATFLVHFGAALYHGLIRRDGVFGSMTSWAQGSMHFARTNPACTGTLAAHAEGDAAAGEKIFAHCAPCHSTKPGESMSDRRWPASSAARAEQNQAIAIRRHSRD